MTLIFFLVKNFSSDDFFYQSCANITSHRIIKNQQAYQRLQEQMWFLTRLIYFGLLDILNSVSFAKIFGWRARPIWYIFWVINGMGQTITNKLLICRAMRASCNCNFSVILRLPIHSYFIDYIGAKFEIY